MHEMLMSGPGGCGTCTDCAMSTKSDAGGMVVAAALGPCWCGSGPVPGAADGELPDPLASVATSPHRPRGGADAPAAAAFEFLGAPSTAITACYKESHGARARTRHGGLRPGRRPLAKSPAQGLGSRVGQEAAAGVYPAVPAYAGITSAGQRGGVCSALRPDTPVRRRSQTCNRSHTIRRASRWSTSPAA